MASTNRSSNPLAIYRRHEKMKKRSYEDRIRKVEHSSFTPLIFFATGGMAHQWSLNILQTTCLPPIWEMDQPICCCFGLDLLLSIILFITFSHPMFEGFSLVCSWLFWLALYTYWSWPCSSGVEVSQCNITYINNCSYFELLLGVLSWLSSW